VAARLPSYLEDILAAIAAQLASATSLPPSAIHMTLDPNEPPPVKTGQTMLTYCPASFPLDQPEFAGASIVAPTFNGVLEVSLWIRVLLDQPGRAEAYLTNQVKGGLALMRKIMGSNTQPSTGLLGFDPLDDQGNPLLKQPMRMLPSGWRTVPGQRPPDWRRIASGWELAYTQKLP
jgi:hypothetical protein